jgi:Family of unknown function (DUF6440)
MTRAGILALVLLAGCEDATQQRLLILTDQNTGCQYIGRQTGITTAGDLKPLLDERGKQICTRPADGPA